jgi:hypothetical protein
MQNPPRPSPDDYARSFLLRIVPTGYRLIDASDSRFAGVRQDFIRLAFKHIGPQPSLVGFCAPGTDAVAAATGLAEWADRNIQPTAVQPRVNPGVLVIAIEPREPVEPGRLPEAAVPAAIWTVGPGGARTRGRPPGAPSPRVLKDVAGRLMRGEPAPTIGHIDVAERTLMSGRGRQRTFALSSGAILLLLVAGYFGLRYLPALLAPARPSQAASACGQPGCLVLDPTSLGTQPVATTATTGQTLRILFRNLTDCPRPADPTVVTLVGCVGSGDQSAAIGTYRALRPGSSELDLKPAGLSGHFSIVVR